MNKSLLSLTLVLFSGIATPAAADGLPLPADQSENGIVTPGGGTRFVTASTSGKTAVLAQDTRGDWVLGVKLIQGRLTVPLVSYDGTAGGLSGDEKTLVLINPRKRFPRRRTSFAIVGLDRQAGRIQFELRRRVHLRGDFSFDALSPDGRSLFLINYVSRRDPTQYRVRVYDLERGRLEPKAIVDPRESPDEMNGYPVTRVMSPDRRWAYTLYDGSEGHAFIHALDTRAREAVCIDLDDVHGDPYGLRLEMAEDGGTMRVLRGERALAVVDAETFSVSAVPDPVVSRRRRSDLGGLPWVVPAVLLVVSAGAAGLALRRLRSRRVLARLRP